MNTSEIWKEVVGFEGRYEVSSEGRVKSYCRKEPRILVQIKCSWRKEYRKVKLVRGSPIKVYTRTVHSLVAEAFLGARKPGWVVHHKNRRPWDNRFRNLKWMGRLQHHKTFIFPRGEKHHKHKLSVEQVRQIKSDLSAGVSLSILGAMYGVTKENISAIKRGVTWSWVLS